MGKTRGIDYLKARKIDFEILEYDHQVKGAEFAAKALKVPLEQMIKTIVLKDDQKNYYFCCLPGNKEIPLKSISRQTGIKKLEISSFQEAEKITGYLVGGISPFGSKKHLPVFLDQELQSYEFVYINGGKRGVILKLEFPDLFSELNPQLVEIA